MRNNLLTGAAAIFFSICIFTACNNEASQKEPVAVMDTANNPKDSMMVQPEAPKDIVDIIVRSEDHTTLAAAMKAAALIDTLKNAGPFTLFAPTNKAFNTLPAGKVDGLLTPEGNARLIKILTYHVVPGNIIAADLKNGQQLTTLEGQVLKVSIKAGKVKINGANITTADLAGKNGVVHVIDAVLMPKK